MKLLDWLRFDPPHILAEQMKLIDDNLMVGLFGNLLVAAAISFVININLHAPTLAYWVLAMAAVNLVIGVYRRLMPERTQEIGARRYALFLCLMLAIGGSLWGYLSISYMRVDNMAITLAILSVLSGMVAASVAVLGACRLAALSATATSVVPTWLFFLIYPGMMSSAMAIATPIYMLVILYFINTYSSHARQAIELRFENLDLIRDLQLQTGRVNAALALAEQANRAKSVVIASASHDLRQPLHALGLFLVALQRTKLDPKQTELLNHINASAEATREMLNTLLDFSRLDAGVIQPKIEDFELQDLLSKLEREFAPQAEVKGLVYRSRESRQVARADLALTEQIMRNLVANAIRYTECGGLVLAARKRIDGISLEVWDTGIGIDNSKFGEIFQPFLQLANPERDRRKGLGLGLAIAEGHAKLMGCEISVASKPGFGSVFKLKLPSGEIAEDALPIENSSEFTELQDLCALVVDDDISVLAGMGVLLDSWGCTSLCCESLEQAIAHLNDGFKPDLVIVDYRLRGHQTGRDAITAIRTAAATQIPAVIVTGDTTPERIVEASQVQAKLLHKPVSPTRLYQAMLQLSNR